MAEFLGALRALVELFNDLRLPVRTVLVQPAITVCLMIGLYAVWNVRNEGGLISGLRVAFLDTRESKLVREKDLEEAIIRAEMYQVAESDKLIDQLLRALLLRSPRAARVRLGVIHNGVTGVTGIGLLRYDMVNAVAAPGHAPGSQTQNDSLSDWGPFLSGLLAGRCEFINVDGFQNAVGRTRLQELGVEAILACPVASVQGTLLGGVFVMWGGGEVPRPEELEPLKAYAQQIGSQIAAALDLRVPTPRLSSQR